MLFICNEYPGGKLILAKLPLIIPEVRLRVPYVVKKNIVRIGAIVFKSPKEISINAIMDVNIVAARGICSSPELFPKNESLEGNTLSTLNA